MNTIAFSKYCATGNDFIVIDNRNPDKIAQKNWDKNWISKICHRRFGIGADGLLLLENSKRPNCDYKMRYFNSDGGECAMCGNGARSLIHFATSLGLTAKNKEAFLFETANSQYRGQIDSSGDVWVEMSELSDFNKIALDDIRSGQKALFLNTGVPHSVFLVDDVGKIDVAKEGKKLAHLPRFPEGTNVNFFQVLEKNKLKIRTFERGVEDETLSCGTGVMAVALAYQYFFDCEGAMTCHTEGGLITVKIDNKTNSKLLCGKVEKIFEGQLFF